MSNDTVSWITDGSYYLFTCPHCGAPVQVEGSQVNCRIFRHGQYKNTYMVRVGRTEVVRASIKLDDIKGDRLQVGSAVQIKNPNTAEFEEGVILGIRLGQQVPPHTSQAICDQLAVESSIWGCGKPFQLHKGATGRVEYVTKCQYI